MKRFVWKIVCILPLGIILIGINLWVDPAGLFHRELERQVAAFQLQGLNAANVRNYDDREVLRYYVDGLEAGKDVLVFGSSRSMVIDASFFPDKTMFNASVTAGTLQDVIANYQLFHTRGYVPERIVIGVEPYMLNRNYNNKRYLHDAYAQALERLGFPDPNVPSLIERCIDRRYAQLVSPSYFQASLGNLSRIIERGRLMPYATTEFVVDETMVRADGSLSYDMKRRVREADYVRTKAQRFVAKHPEELANFRTLDENACRLFEAFITDLLNDGVEVIFLLAPYHPVSYEMMQANEAYQCVAKAETYFTDFAKQKGIARFGSYDPAVCVVAAEDFYDAVHATPEALKRGLAGKAELWRK